MNGRAKAGRDWWGEGLTALCAGALAVVLLLVVALLGILAVNGSRHFWQSDLARLELDDGTTLLGEIRDREPLPEAEGDAVRLRLKRGNRELTGVDSVWVDERRIVSVDHPPEATLLERLEWGDFYGTMVRLQRHGRVLARGAEESWAAFRELHPQTLDRLEAVNRLERQEIGDINYRMEKLRLARRRLALESVSPAERRERQAAIARAEGEALVRHEELTETLREAQAELLADVLVVETADGIRQSIPLGQIVRALQPNRMGPWGKLGLCLARIRAFLIEDPRESNTEGGIFPAIFGTVMMVFLMSFAVAPLGVLAALYLREYARQGPLVRLVRIAVSNLAAVPSIVFGVFGLGFFVYFVGGTIDRLFYPEALPAPTYGTGGILWASLTLALLTLPVVIVATEEGLAAVPAAVREASVALGATKFETTWRVVLPAAAPGMLTGLILAIARAAGEVAPLMIVGMVKLAPALPIDHHFPFVHLERKFMHLGFHIYDVGFQSPNVEAGKPLAFATALLLVVVVVLLNLVAIWARSRLRRAYAEVGV